MNSNLIDLPAPIFKKFTLKGLNGYKNVSLTCNSAVKIASADNGSGKTSLLNALYATFEGRPSLLYSIDFNSLEFVWSDGSLSSWEKKELFGDFSDADLEKCASDRVFTQWNISKEETVDMLTKFILRDMDEVIQTPAYKEIYRESPYDRQEIFDILSSITGPIINMAKFSELHERARVALGDCTILYLPTYRRIEADIAQFRSGLSMSPSSGFRTKNRGQKDAWDSSKLIFFGMADVESKLTSIVTQIRKETLEAYSRSNGQTLEQLVGNDPVENTGEKEQFDWDAIEAVLARVGKDLFELRTRLNEIISSGEIYSDSRRELRRFLSQLLKVYAERREDEQAIEKFVKAVNRYFSPDDEMQSEKWLEFDKLKLELAIMNKITNKEIKFGNLSSGEKQVVSIFARLMLDPRRSYLVLVDEPELSLSLEWQQKLLPDICSSQNCRQLIAITHSPFIFDNALAVVAGTIEADYFVSGHNNE